MNLGIQGLLRERPVVARTELQSLGMSRSALQREIRSGIWRRVGPNILVHHSAAGGLMTNTLIAALWVPTGVLTGPSAAMLSRHPAWAGQDLRRQPAMVIAARNSPGPWRAVRHPGALWDVNHRGIRVADHHTTLIDLLRFLPWDQAAAIGGAARRHGLANPTALEDSVRRLRSAQGVTQLRLIASALTAGAESGPEVDLHLLLRRARIQGWVGNPTVVVHGNAYRPDVAFLSLKVALEYDGVAEHSGTPAFHPDRLRQNRFVFGDWRIIRVTKQMLLDPDMQAELLGELRALLTRCRAEMRPNQAAA